MVASIGPQGLRRRFSYMVSFIPTGSKLLSESLKEESPPSLSTISDFGPPRLSYTIVMGMKKNPQLSKHGNVLNDEMDEYSTECSDPSGKHVKSKWRGTAQGKLDMNALGRHQIL